MKGCFSLQKGIPPEILNPQAQGGLVDEQIFVESRQKLFRQGKAFFLCEGYLLRFIDTEASFLRDDPLGSLLTLYARAGESFVRHLDGFFLLFFSPDGERYFLVNNRAESHRLYSAQSGNYFYFADSLRELLRISGLPRTPHFGSLRSFMANGFTMSGDLHIQGVQRILPSEYFLMHQHSLKKLSYWRGDLRFERRSFENLEAHLDRYERLYREGLERYFEAKNPSGVGTLLSGGHDTSFVTCQATQVWKKPFHTFTVTFPGWAFDEGGPASHISQKFGAIHHSIPFVPPHMDQVVSLILANEEPVAGSSLPLHILARSACSHVDLLLGGDGGDTLWGEYYPVGEYHRWVKHLPTTTRRWLHLLAKRLRDLTDWERFWELEHVAGLFAQDDYLKDFLRKLCTYRHFDENFQNKLLVNEFRQAPFSQSSNQILFTQDNFEDALIEGKLKDGFFTYQALHTTKIANYFGMDLYLPTLDKAVIDFICSLPKEWINGGTSFHRLTNNKKINRLFHKKALARYLSSSEIYNRSFDIPWYNILRPRKEVLHNLQRRLIQRGWYNEHEVKKLFDEFESQTIKSNELLELKHHGYRIFTLLSTEIWASEYLDNRSTSDDPKLKLEDYLSMG